MNAKKRRGHTKNKPTHTGFLKFKKFKTTNRLGMINTMQLLNEKNKVMNFVDSSAQLQISFKIQSDAQNIQIPILTKRLDEQGFLYRKNQG